jgi:retron-type reverse transcriptase
MKDQTFINLTCKYLKTGFGESLQTVSPMKISVIQSGVLSPILSNIYMSFFDEWVENVLVPSFNKGERRKLNPLYFRTHRTKTKDKTIRSID